MPEISFADLLTDLVVELDLRSADGRAGVQTILSEIERRAPGSLDQAQAALQARRLGLRGMTQGEA